ncbi:MAG TPA: pilus assembly PilX N-terminal domain-containing protein [Candidatus Polarisedimenticolia bacterium]|nr:pilus assembly PilX N-terminal domain-containing protein [Candidatus Polarisedimenticolia bacterium]
MNRPARENGSALLITMMVMVILTLLGLSYLFLADTENLIAQNQRDSDQLLFVAEAGARMVKAMFDRPPYGAPSDPNSVLYRFLNTYDMRNSAYYDRAQRIFDHDNDPNTADVAADGTSGRPYYRQGLTVDPNLPAYLSFFDKPYRGSAVAAFMGTEAGPDLILQSNSLDPNASGSLDLLDQLNGALLADQPNTGRIQRIDIYAPPVIMVNGTPTRYGIATVKVTAAKFRHLGEVGGVKVTTPTSRQVAERVVKMVLNEAPYPGPAGPLQSCQGISTNGAFAVRWGTTTSIVDTTISPSEAQLKNRAAQSVPWATQKSYISGADLTNYIAARAGTASATLDDPWFQIVTGGTFNPPLDPNTSPGNLIIPYPYNAGTPTADDNSNLFQHSVVSCPSFEYDLWKNVAQSGFGDAHYFVPVGNADSWRENGVGAAKTFAQWTKGNKGGLYFFDTMDGLPPDPNGTNLIDEVFLTAADDWAGGGFAYLNALNMEQQGIDADGVNRVLLPPGEPYVDANGNKAWDPNEQYVNLQYATTAMGSFVVDPNAGGQTSTQTAVTGESFTYTNSSGRDDQGLPILQAINWYGVIYTSGMWEAAGNGNFFGSIVTRMGVVSTAGTPNLWFDERLIKGQWPPPDIQLPRTMITVWQTDL